MEKKLITIKSSVRIKDIENAYAILLKNRTSDIEIPLQITNRSIGLIPSLLQFIFTWDRLNPDGTVYTQIDESSLHFQEMLDKQAADYFSYVCILHLWRHKFLSLQKNDLKSSFKSQIVSINKLMNNLKATSNEDAKSLYDSNQHQVNFFKDSSLLLVCSDQARPQNGLLYSFYPNHANFVHSSLELTQLWENGIEVYVLKFKRGYKDSLKDKLRDDILEIIFQLMENTDKWAKADEKNNILKPNSRGIYIKLHKASRNTFVQSFKENKNLAKYFKSNELKESNDGLLHFLEISIFDSGPGFVRCYTHDNEDIIAKEEISIVKKCLTKYLTSERKIGRQRGFGLPLVLETLNGKGLLRIRTSRCSVYRDLINDPFEFANENSFDSIKINDWESGLNSSFFQMQKIEGSILTALYPL